MKALVRSTGKRWILNASGKMIGVISHVDALKERIPVQIEIKKMSGLGVSRLDSKYVVS